MSLISRSFIHLIVSMITKSIKVHSSTTTSDVTLFSVEIQSLSSDYEYDPITFRLYSNKDILECNLPITPGITSYDCDVSDQSLVKSNCTEMNTLSTYTSSTTNSTFLVMFHNPNQHGIAVQSISITDSTQSIHEVDSFCHQTSLQMNGKMGVDPTGWQCRDFNGVNEYDAFCIDPDRNDYPNCAAGNDIVGVQFGEGDEGLVFQMDYMQPINCSSSYFPSTTLVERTTISDSTESADSIQYTTTTTESNVPVHGQSSSKPSTTKTWSIVHPDYAETSPPIKSGASNNFLGNESTTLVVLVAIFALILVMVMVYLMYNRGRKKKQIEGQRERVIVVVDQNNIIGNNQMDGNYGNPGDNHYGDCPIALDGNYEMDGDQDQDHYRGREHLVNAIRNVPSVSPMGAIPGEVMTDGRGIYTVPNCAFDDDIDTLDMDVPSDHGLIPEVDTGATEGDDGETEALMDGCETGDDSDAQSADDHVSQVGDEDICTAMPNEDTPGDC